MGFSRFPRKKKIKWIEVQTPHACIHLEKFMYPLALVSGAPHKAYIFRFNTPTNNTFPASSTHTCLILRGYPPLVPIHFWQKVRRLTPPLCSYIIRNVGSTPPTPEPVGVGDPHPLTHPLTHFTSLPFPSLHFTSLHSLHSLSHPSLTHTTLTSLTHTLTHSLYINIHTYIHTNSPTITAPSLLYFLFPSCFAMLSLSLKKLVTCGVIRSSS